MISEKADNLVERFESESKYYDGEDNSSLNQARVTLRDYIASLELQLSEARARLAWYEEGYDPATNPPDDSDCVFVKTNDGGQYYAVYDCPSDDSIARFIVLPYGEFTPIFSINDITRWFPLPGAAFGELAKGAE